PPSLEDHENPAVSGPGAPTSSQESGRVNEERSGQSLKRFAILSLAILAAPVCLFATTHTVTIAPGGNFTFDPSSQTINVGDTVMWVWGLGVHSTTSGALCFADDTWNSGLLVPPNSF